MRKLPSQKVYNFLVELYKTADCRERWEIEKYVIQSESMRLLKCCVSNFDEASVRAARYIPCLNATVDDPDKNPWLLNQTAAEWSVSGDTSEQSMFILYGTGANGKSTFLNVIQNILGDYALSTWAETFMKRNNDTTTNDIARLRGARFVTTSETEQGKRLPEHLIKQVTGNDALTARFLYGEYFNFVPTFKIFMASNHIASRKLVKGGNR
jgi:P4 family phage/plasmid primase-like protien